MYGTLDTSAGDVFTMSHAVMKNTCFEPTLYTGLLNESCFSL
jgi:hypothetical protein